MAILSNGCKPDNFEPHNSLKLSLTSYILESCVKLSFRELCGSKWSGLHPFDNVAIIKWVKNRLKAEWETVSLWDTNPWSDFVTLIENALRTHHWELITMRVTLLKKIFSELLSLWCKPFCDILELISNYVSLFFGSCSVLSYEILAGIFCITLIFNMQRKLSQHIFLCWWVFYSIFAPILSIFFHVMIKLKIFSWCFSQKSWCYRSHH